MTRMKLLHYGLQRSGTNFLESLLRRRYRIKFVNDGKDRGSIAHKHARLYLDKSLVPEPRYANDLVVDDYPSFEKQLPTVPDFSVVISKDPFSWYLSYRQFALRCSWPEPAHHYIDEYNAFYGSFLKLSEGTDRIQFVRYADLLTDTEGTLSVLQDATGMVPKRSARPGLPSKVPVSSNFDETAAARYRDRTYMNEFDSDELETVKSKIDARVCEGLGYTVD